MKILLLSHKFYPDFGGIEVNSEMLANAFHEAGHEVKVMTWTPESGEKKFPYAIIRNPGIPTLLKENRWADVVFENNPCLRLGWPAYIFKRPTVIALCTWINRGADVVSMQDKLKIAWLKRAAAVIAVSDAVRRKCWPPAIVISNPYRHELFRRLPQIEKTIPFVFLGRLVSDKGVDIAIEAIHQLATNTNVINKERGCLLTIIGEGPEKDNLRQLAERLGIAANIEFAGVLKGEPLVNCLNKHRFMLVPSTWEEPFGNVALEGMACGCLPIVSDGGGLPDAIGNAGITFKRGNATALADCITAVLTDPAIENKLRTAAGPHLAAHELGNIAAEYLQVIDKANRSK